MLCNHRNGYKRRADSFVGATTRHVANGVNAKILVPPAQQYPRALRDLAGHARRDPQRRRCLRPCRSEQGAVCSDPLRRQHRHGGVSLRWAGVRMQTVPSLLLIAACDAARDGG